VDASTVLIKYTDAGDANLDGDVDLDDVGIWSQNFTGALAAGSKTWFQGDWDHDGDVDLDDVGKWSVNFTGVLAPRGPALLATSAASRPSTFSRQPIRTPARQPARLIDQIITKGASLA
jgi:hypothetical protein